MLADVLLSVTVARPSPRPPAPILGAYVCLAALDPLAFLTAELESLKQQGLYRTLRVLDGEALGR